MSQVTAIAMQKGGVGKTTTAINLASGLAFHDQKTLLVDLDPQSNATSGMGIELDEADADISTILRDDGNVTDAIYPTGIRHLKILPSTLALNGVQNVLSNGESGYSDLETHLNELLDKFEWIFLDCPPNLGSLTLNAFRAADSVLIPLQCEYYALEGLSQLWETVQRIRQRLNPALELLGILLTMYDKRTNLSADVEQEVRDHFGEKVFETVIPRNVRISEAPGFGQPVLTYAPDSTGSNAYKNVTEEVLEREREPIG